MTFTFDKGAGTKTNTVYQHGWVDKNNPNGTDWLVSPRLGFFYLPFKLGYKVLDIDADQYSWMVASSPSSKGMASWLYIMTREKVVSDASLEPMRAAAINAGWDLSKAERVPQDPA